MSVSKQTANSSRNLCIRRCVLWHPCFSKQQRDFRLPERDAHDPFRMQTQCLNTDSETKSEPEDFSPKLLAFCPILTHMSHWSSFFRRSDRSMIGQNSLDKQS